MKNISLHPDTIAEVKDRVDLVEIVSDYVVLQKKGREFTGLCPFHDEKTPSFTVNPTKQLYYCFGCGEGGGAVKFLMEIGKQSFREAVLNLAQRYQIPVKTLAPELQQEIQKEISTRDQLYEILAVATSFYQHSLLEKEGEKALKYLQENRKLSQENIQLFKLGYAPKSWQTIYHYLVEIKNYPAILVEQAGLIRKRKSGDGYIDYFRDRLMIPIEDKNGRVIAFGARSLNGENPKYLNSPDTDLFTKNKTLFALNVAKQAISKKDQVIIVEGYFDAIALHSFGINNAVAVLGTALTENHVKLLARFTESKEVIVNFDADKAGLKATQRAIKEVESLIYNGQLKLKVLTIPNGKDADEFLHSQENAQEKYQELIDKSILWLDWQIQQIISLRNLQQSTDYELAFQSLVRLLSKISNNLTRDYYLSYCTEILCAKRNKLGQINNQEYQKIYQTFRSSLTYTPNKNYPNPNPNPNSRVTKKSANKKITSQSSDNIQVQEAEFLLLLIYLHCPDYRQQIIDLLDEKDLIFSIKNHRFIWQKIHQRDQVEGNLLLEILRENMINHPLIAKQLNSLFYPDQNHQQKLFNPEIQIQNAIVCLERIRLEKYKQHCQSKIRELLNQENTQECNFYNQELRQTENQINHLLAQISANTIR